MVEQLQTARISLRLFLEGVEVPIISGNFTAGLNSPATASLAVPANDALHKLKPRTVVHVFYLDPVRYSDAVNSDSLLREDRKDPNYRHAVKTGENGGTTTLSKEQLESYRKENSWPGDWKLIFTGEILGYRYSKTHGQRQAVLLCQDFTTYWNNARLYFGSGKLTGSSRLKQEVFAGTVVARRGRSKINSRAKLQKILMTRPSSIPTITGLLGGCVHLLESITGVYTGGSEVRKYRGVSDFLSITEMRLSLTKMLGVTPKDDSSYKLTSGTDFKKLIRRISRGTRSTSSYGQLLSALLNFIHYSWASQLCPAYIPKGAKAVGKRLVPSGTKIPRGLNALKKEVGEELDKLVNAAAERTNEVIGRNTTVAIGSKENDVFQSAPVSADGRTVMGKDLEGPNKFSEKYGKGGEGRILTTRKRVNKLREKIEKYAEDTKGLDAKGKPKRSKSDIAALRGLRLAVDKLDKATDVADDIVHRTGVKFHLKSDYDKNKGVVKDLLGPLSTQVTDKDPTNTPVNTKKGDQNERNTNLDNAHRGTHGKTNAVVPGLATYNVFSGHTLANFSKMNGLATAGKRLLKYSVPKFKAVPYDIQLTDRLHTVVMSPNIWWAPPPRCNVVFPDMYNSITFSRNFNSEVTRVWMSQLKSSGRQNLKVAYFAPDTTAFLTGKSSKSTVAKAAMNSTSIMFPHEKFSGIIPVFESVGNLKALNALSRKTSKQELKLAKEGELGAQIAKEISKGKLISPAEFGNKHPALARAANARFFEKRYLPRQASVSGPFNPNLVAAAPMVIVDPAFGGDVSAGYGQVKGKHILGYPVSITHKISHQNASTSVSLAYCREHTEGLEDYAARDVKKKFYDSGLVKIRNNRGKPILAEVFGWKVREVPAKIKKGKVIKPARTIYEPILGGRGVRGRQGKHIGQMLYVQSGGASNIDKATDYDFDGASYAPFNLSKPELFGIKGGYMPPDAVFSNPYPVDTEEHGQWNAEQITSKTFAKYSLSGNVDLGGVSIHDKRRQATFLVKPKRHGRESGGPTMTKDQAENYAKSPTGKIPDTMFVNGYKFLPPKEEPTIHPSALGWCVVNAYRRVRPPKSGEKQFSFTFEQIARPPWCSKIFFNKYIGDDFYKPIFGCGSVTDSEVVMQIGRDNESLLKSARSSGIGTQSGALAASADERLHGLQRGLEESHKHFGASSRFQYGYIDEKTLNVIRKGTFSEEGALAAENEILDILNPAQNPSVEFGGVKFLEVDLSDEDAVGGKRTVTIPTYHLGGFSIEEAVNNLATGYVMAKESGNHSFTHAYTQRSFASMIDVFGMGTTYDNFSEADLKKIRLSEKENKDLVVGTRFVDVLPQYVSQEALYKSSARPVEGFHSRAFSDHGELKGLLGLNTLIDYHASAHSSGSSKIKFDPNKLPDDHLERIQGDLDPRRERRQCAIDYRNECGYGKEAKK